MDRPFWPRLKAGKDIERARPVGQALLVLVAVVGGVSVPVAAQTPASQAAATPTPQLSAEGGERLSAHLREAVESGLVPGVVALVVSRDGVIYREAFGKANVAAGMDLSDDALFNIASMTKPITSVAIMMLREQGWLGLDDPVEKFLPEFAGREVVARFDEASGEIETRPARRPITIRHLLTHTSGIGYAFSNELTAQLQAATGRSPEELPLIADPGTLWAYGASTGVLGRVVEAITGRPLDAFLRDRILEPLGMQDTAYVVPAGARDRVVTSHQRADGTLQERPVPETVQSPVRGDGGLYSTASDYGTFLRMLLNDGELHGTRFLRSASVRLMFENHIGALRVQRQPAVTPALSQAFPLGAGRDTFGLGFQIASSQDAGRRQPGSGSWAGIFNTHFWVDPQTGVGAVLLMQVLPFYDDDCIAVLTGFEERLYASLE